MPRLTTLLLCAAPLLPAQEPTAPKTAPTKEPTAAVAAYDPLLLPEAKLPPSRALTARDEPRQRELPLRVFLPVATAPAPVVLFSHGLGGTRDTCNYLGTHWAARGYAVVFVQHPGSDDSVWKDLPLAERMPAMQRAASAANFVLRCDDVKATLDTLTTWNTTDDHACCGRFDLEHVGMAGHSFGAVTTQAVGGQVAPLIGQKYTDARIDAAIAMSPSIPRAGKPQVAFGKVAIPWLLMTGTDDVAAIGDQDAASRLLVYPALPATIDRYELVLDGAEHSAFTERNLPGDRGKRNPNHHRSILALSTAFWDAHLRSDAAAKAWLQGDGAKSVLQPKDRWQVGVRAAPAAAGAPK